MEIKGNFGKCIFGDCIELLEKNNDHFDVAFVDPPYNVHTEKPIFFLAKFQFEKGIKNKIYDEKKNTKSYLNDFTEKDYYSFCIKWFELIYSKCNRIIITPGFNNISFWLSRYPDLKMGIWIRRNSVNRGSFSLFCSWEPILFIGKFNRCYNNDLFDINIDMGFLRKDDTLVHPHPKPIKLIEKLLIPIKPTSVIDIMIGSGTTAFVCEKHGIPWLGMELEEQYKQDIEKQISAGINEHSRLKNTIQSKVI